MPPGVIQSSYHRARQKRRAMFFWVIAIAFLFLLAFWTTGCNTTGTPLAKPTASASQLAPLNAAGAEVQKASDATDEALRVFDARIEQLHSELRADIDFTREANQNNPDGTAKVIVDSQLEVAQSRLANVAPSPAVLALAAANKALVESGKAAEARAAYAGANKAALDLAGELAKANTAKDAAIANEHAAIEKEATERKKHETQLENNRLANQAAIETLEAKHKKEMDDARNGVLKQQAFWANCFGAALFVIFGVSIWVASMSGNIIGGFKAGWPLLFMALLAFGLAQIVSQPWFKWAVLGVLVIGGGLAVWWVMKHEERGTLKNDALAEVAKLKEAALPVVSTLDEAYSKAEPAIKDWMDQHIFQPIRYKFSGTDGEATIHEIKAEIAAPPTN